MATEKNSFKDLERAYAAGLPPGLERRVSSQTTNFAVFGRVVEVYMPNALQAVVQMIGGSSGGPETDPIPGRRPAPDEWPDWRQPPGRP
ncbi:MAG: hypothetical protein JNK89_11355 [Saprospiraceae bacterium]|nr:hypothetical protein [Saprospiraceae bacterium]